MKIHLATVKESELTPTFAALGAQSQMHVLVTDPSEADLILLIGSFAFHPRLLLQHPAYLAFPYKCAVYTEDDDYLPLVPGVYCSAEVDGHSRAGRTFSSAYVSRNGLCTNTFVRKNLNAEKKYLFSFQGGSTSLLRKRLFNVSFNRPDVLVENTSTYSHWDVSQTDREHRQKRYAEVLSQSHFVLCPRGVGAGSIRFFEVMSAGVCPVLIADDYLLPPRIDWDRFLLRVRESEIARIPEILEPHRATSAKRGRLAEEAYIANFDPQIEFDQIVESCHAAVRHGPPSERVFRLRQAPMIAGLRLRRHLRKIARGAALQALKVLHRKSPYQMNR